MREQEEIEPFPLWIVIICAIIICFFASKVELKPRPTGDRYPVEILQPVHLVTLPHLMDDDTEDIVFIKRGCLKATRDEVEALRDKNSSERDVYIIGGKARHMDVKLCGE